MYTISNQNNSPGNTIVWGIRVKPEWKRRWHRLSLLLGVSTGRLINYVLGKWVENNPGLLRDAAARTTG